MSTPAPFKDYVAGVAVYAYPGLGEKLPPGGAKVLLLTRGGICTSGTWSNDGRYLAWSPLPSRSEYTYPAPDGSVRPGSGDLLLLTIGEICVFGPWTNDGRYLGWTELPKRDRAKEGVLLAQYWPPELLAA